MPKGDGKKTEHGIAGEAHDLVYGARAHTYGHPRLDFSIIAAVWTGLLKDKLKPGEELDEYRVAVMMTGLKLARLVKSPGHRDSRIDTIGYMLTMERLDEVDDYAPGGALYGHPEIDPRNADGSPMEDDNPWKHLWKPYKSGFDFHYGPESAPAAVSDYMTSYNEAWDQMPPQYKPVPSEAPPAVNGPVDQPRAVAWKDGDPEFGPVACTCYMQPRHAVNGHLFDGQSEEELRASIRWMKSAENWGN